MFLNALGIRWLIIDEVSCVAAELLGLLDIYLRRACARHPYARRGGGLGKKRSLSERLFGGLSLVFSGHLWQLPPVMATAIFSNSTLRSYRFEVQKIFDLFWRAEQDSVQKTIVLTQRIRTGDPWLREVLEADRNGKESWGFFCSQHGIPIRKPGSCCLRLESLRVAMQFARLSQP